MKYSEFKTIAKENGWEFDMDEVINRWVYVNKDGFEIAISQSERNHIELRARKGSAIELTNEKSFIKACYELAETPIEDREDDKEYYLRHMFLGVKSDNNYLNINTTNGGLFLMDGQLDHWNVYKTKFTERELDKIEDTGFDLRNFELVEVEEEQKYYAKIKGWELFVDFVGAQYWGEVSNYGRLGFVNVDGAKDRTKDEWRRLGINDTNADFVLVEEMEE